MPKVYTTDPLPNGTIVRILNSGYGPAMIVGYCGELGPQGARVYSVRVRKKPRPVDVEVLEEQLEKIPEK